MTAAVDLDARRRLPGHPLRALGDRHRQGDDRPPRGPQRVPAADRARADRRLRPHPRRRLDRLRAADRRGRHGLLLGRRPEVQEPRGRLPRQRRPRPPQRPRPPAPDPLAADPGHRPRQRLRDRRRPRPARRVRPLDRERERDLRPGRAAGRQLRRRLRHRPARPPRRRQEGQGDLVPVPPVLGPGGARDEPRQQGRAAGRPRGRGRAVGRRDPRDEPDRDPVPEVGVPRRHRRPGRAPGVRRQRDRPVLHDRRGPRGLDGVPREAPARVPKYPRRP